jgi:two-component system response regulator AtoC
MPEVLVVDDDTSLRETVRDLLLSADYRVIEAADGREALEVIREHRPDAVLCDWKMPRAGGDVVLKELKQYAVVPGLPVIVFTAFGDGESAMLAMQEGAYDFLVKPVDANAVLLSVKRALHHSNLTQELNRLQQARFRDEHLAPLHEDGARLIGSSPSWIEVFKAIGQVARTDVTVLLQGETGTGKEVVARAIHQNSKRSQRPMITVNCAAIPAELVESELFGHERGSFTGAVSQKIGKFEAANEGTLFLDEIGELPLALQPKLLRVLQERTFERVGSTTSQNSDVRIIAATNRDLAAEVAMERFRADLYYRLNAFAIRLPALRERRSDIAPLARYFLFRFSRRNGSAESALSQECIHQLEQHPFQGNVRELEQLMDRVAVKAAGRPVSNELLQTELATRTGEKFSRFEEWEALPFHDAVGKWERHLIERAMRQAGNNKAEAARLLGIQRRLLYEKLQQFGADRRDERERA